MTYPDLVPMTAPVPYVPRVFGYRIHQSSNGRPQAGQGGASSKVESKRGSAKGGSSEKSEVSALREEVAALKAQLHELKKKRSPDARMAIE